MLFDYKKMNNRQLKFLIVTLIFGEIYFIVEILMDLNNSAVLFRTLMSILFFIYIIVAIKRLKSNPED
jgi:hypothetical protein